MHVLPLPFGLALAVLPRREANLIRTKEDRPIVVRDPQLEDQVTAVHAVAQGLEEQGFGEQLLAALFKFDGGKHPVYFVYGYKRGAFWPFVPTGEDQERDNAEELELKAKLDGELPIEPELSRWFGLFDAPL